MLWLKVKLSLVKGLNLFSYLFDLLWFNNRHWKITFIENWSISLSDPIESVWVRILIPGEPTVIFCLLVFFYLSVLFSDSTNSGRKYPQSPYGIADTALVDREWRKIFVLSRTVGFKIHPTRCVNRACYS